MTGIKGSGWRIKIQDESGQRIEVSRQTGIEESKQRMKDQDESGQRMSKNQRIVKGSK